MTTPDPITQRLNAALEGRYRVEHQIGSGGMATVYLAQDLKHARSVALKVLKPDLAASIGKDRFLREIEIAARLNHPHILTLIDSGEADGLLYFVMPFIEGQSLRERLDREGELPVEDVTRVLEQVVDALAYAHGVGLVHRDIKPENVMMQGRHAVVMDFGIARAVSEATGAGGVTETGIALGTPAYMAPEQAVADPGLDHRADLYAVGVLGYELLTGRPPFDGKSPQEVLAAHVTQPPMPVSAKRAATPVGLAHLVTRALAKKPADRWQTAEEMLVELDKARVSSGGITPHGGFEPPRSLNRRLILVMGLVVVAAVTVWLARPRAGPGHSGNRIAVLAFANAGAEDDSYFSDGIARDLSTQLSKLGSFEVVAHGAARQYSGSQTGYDVIGRTLHANYLVEGSVRRSGDAVRVTVSLIDPDRSTEVWSDRYDRQLTVDEYFEIQSDIVRQIAEALELAVTPEERAALAERPTDDLEAYNAYLQGRYHFSQFTGQADDRLAAEYLLHAIERDSTFALAYAALADLIAARGAVVGQDHSDIMELRGLNASDIPWPTEDSFEAARRLALKALLLDSTLAEPHTTLGAVQFWWDWDWAASRDQFERAIAMDPGIAQGHQWYSEWLMAQNLPDSAVIEARRATELDPGSPVIQWGLVRHLTLARRFDEAKALAVEQLGQQAGSMLAVTMAQVYAEEDNLDSVKVWLLAAMHRFGVPDEERDAIVAALDSIGVAAMMGVGLPPDPEAIPDERLDPTLAIRYLGVGNHEAALQVLERNHRLKGFSKIIPDLVMARGFDPIRGEPRFKAILADMGLPDISEDVR